MDAQELKGRLVGWLKTPQGTGLGLAAMIGFVMSGVVLLAFDPSPSPIGATATTIPMAESDEAARAYLEQAREYADKEDYQKAHNILRAIPESSPVRELEEYRAVEDAWADSMLAKAAELDDAAEKLALLNRISETTSVSPGKRQNAAEMALAIDPAKTRPAGEGGATSIYDDTSDARPASSAAKADLIAKMRNGTATPDELRMLMALCMSEGDNACRNAAYAQWKKKTGK